MAACIFVLLMAAEQIPCFGKTAPAVSCGYRQRAAVARQIAAEIPNTKTILDIGSGYGAMVRTLAKSLPNAKIIGAEIMPTPWIYSATRHIFVKNARFVFGDAFKFLRKSNRNFDVGITYLLHSQMRELQEFLPRFKILIAVDFPLPDVKPYKKLKLHRDRFAQHWMYVYKS
ncbi:MAG: methyltransferase domain-containing protein [Rickettsiales bacterium]|jgi:ubiquinone/menaquinone biosynthesis C-methylase UbiE|nr:methyltransferase domain-containing protein [Rickettsiales bacterium]